MTTNFLRVLCVAAGLQADAMAQVAWMQVASAVPLARAACPLAYDSQRGTTVMFGGRCSLGNQLLGDTWEWNGSNWAQTTGVGPSARYDHAMVYDSQRGRTVLFGGTGGIIVFGDTWEWNGSSWLQVSSTGPSARYLHAMAYDSQRRKTVVFGGYAHNGNSYLGDTWEWDGISWTQVATNGPSARLAPAMACDSQRGRTVLFGGYVAGNVVGDTWEWDGTSWSQVATSGPTPRIQGAMVYDSQRGCTVLFGGSNNFFLLNDTWEWSGSGWSQVATTGPTARADFRMAYDSQRGKTVLFGGYSVGGSYLDETWEYGPAIAAAATPFGNGCGNPTLTLSAVVNACPRLATTAQASLTNIPSSIAFVALGWSRTSAGPFPLPFPLAGYGMPSCNMLQSTEAAAQPVTLTGIGTATYSLQLPNWSGLIGLHLYLQGWAVAPGANAGNTIVSNGLEWVIGY